MLEQLGITVLRVREPFGFTWELSSGELERLTLRHNEVFRQAVERCGDGEKTLLILDELAAALNTGTIDEGMVSWALQHKPEALELEPPLPQPARAVASRAARVRESSFFTADSSLDSDTLWTKPEGKSSLKWW